MKSKCDIYIPTPTLAPELKYARLFDKSFAYDQNCKYFGYVGLELPRLRAVFIVTQFRARGVFALAVPLKYKSSTVSIEQARELAVTYANSKQCGVSSGEGPLDAHSPLYWCFAVTYYGNDDRVGGKILIDRFDGHVWSLEELEEYMYDYNNVLE